MVRDTGFEPVTPTEVKVIIALRNGCGVSSNFLRKDRLFSAQVQPKPLQHVATLALFGASSIGSLPANCSPENVLPAKRQCAHGESRDSCATGARIGRAGAVSEPGTKAEAGGRLPPVVPAAQGERPGYAEACGPREDGPTRSPSELRGATELTAAGMGSLASLAESLKTRRE